MNRFRKCYYCQLDKYLTPKFNYHVCHECSRTIQEFQCQVCNKKWLRDINKNWGILPIVVNGLNLCEDCNSLLKTFNKGKIYNKYFFSTLEFANELKNTKEENRKLQLKQLISTAGYNPEIDNLIYLSLE